MAVRNNEKAVRWPKFSKRRHRKSTHYEDPIVVRRCPYCERKHNWPMSQTSAGQDMFCLCGGVFNSWRNPSWCHSGKKLSRVRSKPQSDDLRKEPDHG